MQIKKASMGDLDEIMSIYAYAREFMAANGNPNQWKNTNPTLEMIIADIEAQKLNLCIDDNKIACVFYYSEGIDPTYNVIDGAWLDSEPYGVVHRIASAKGTKGAATFALTYAFNKCKNLKIDTHDDNIPMQNLLNKLGFKHCGTITLLNGEPRRAYQKNE
jgi:hypothetical protein